MPRHLVRLFSSLRRLWYRFWHPRERVGQAALVEHLRGGHAKVSEVEADEHAKQPRPSALADLQRAVSAIQGGRRTMRSSQPAFAVDRLDGYCPADGLEHPAARTDGYTNEVTGIGDWTRDKTFGGSPNGPRFDVRFLSGVECEQRWRGSDLGARIVETKPAEMTRQGWEITIQPSEEDDAPEGKADEFPTPQPAAPKHEPGAIPQKQDDSQAIIEALDVQLREMDARDVFRTALSYEIAYGGAAVLVGFDDGETDLTRPLDESKIRGVRHITAFRGGWDGEVIAWRYYRDPTAARYGEPEVYQLRNLGVPISTPPAPGETHYAPIPVGGVTGPMIWYVHESRLLIFPGTAVSHRARVQMRGWGDPVFTRCDEVLSDFDQSWGSVAVILQEFSLATLAIKGLTELLSQGSDAARAEIVSRAVTLQMTQSIARMRLIDSDEKIERITASLSGVPETLQQMSYRLSAAADIPVSLLMGQEPAGLNATGDSTVRFWYDRIAAAQGADLQPNLRRLVRWMLLAKDGPASGVEPARWDVTMRPLWQPTEAERATLRKTTAETDQIYITQGVLTPEEVAASRFGGSKWSGETMLDIEGREAMAALPPAEEEAEPVAEEPAPPALVSVPLAAVGKDDDWVTINGAHILIGEEGEGKGKIVGGPAHMVGHKPSAIPSKSAPATKAPEPPKVAPPPPAPVVKPPEAPQPAPAPQPPTPAPATSSATAEKSEAPKEIKAEQAQKWGDKHFGQWAKELPPAEKAAVDRYIARDDPSNPQGFIKINGDLRKSGGTKVSKTTRDLDAALARGPGAPHAMVVNRKLVANPALMGALKPGGVFQDHGYMSTSVGDIHGGMAANISMKITVPKGTKGAYVSASDKAVGGQQEFLLPRGTKLRIDKVTTSRGFTKVKATVVKE